MELRTYIELVLKDIPVKTKVSFDIGVKTVKGKLLVDMYGSNKIKFSITKLE